MGSIPITRSTHKGCLKEVEHTLNYIYAAVQMNNNDIQSTREEFWAVSDLIVAVYEEEAAAAE